MHTRTLVVLVGVVACGGDSGASAGKEGGPCFDGAYCEPPLTCASQICVDLPGADSGADRGDGGPIGTSGADNDGGDGSPGTGADGADDGGDDGGAGPLDAACQAWCASCDANPGCVTACAMTWDDPGCEAQAQAWIACETQYNDECNLVAWTPQCNDAWEAYSLCTNEYADSGPFCSDDPDDFCTNGCAFDPGGIDVQRACSNAANADCDGMPCLEMDLCVNWCNGEGPLLGAHESPSINAMCGCWEQSSTEDEYIDCYFAVC